MSIFLRTERLIGEEGVALLAAKRVALFGVGGVGGAVAEALARAGIGALDLFDDDRVSESNINRQVVALHSTLGQLKVEVMAARVADINPGCAVRARPVFFSAETRDTCDFAAYDYVVDAVDTVSAKLEIICGAREAGVPVVSAMGAGNKLHPECFEISDIERTEGCPLARVVRRELRKREVRGVKVVYSKEVPHRRAGDPVPASISFVPPAAGLVLAGAVVRDLLGIE